MKIAIFHHLPEGGAKIALFEQIKRLNKKHTFHLFSFISDGGEYDISSICNKTFLFPYEATEATRKSGVPRIIEDLRSFTTLKRIHKEIAKKIDKENYDLAYIHPSRLTQAPYVLRYLKTPSVYYCQEPLRIAYEHGLRLREKVGFIKSSYETLNRFIRKGIDRTNACSATQIITSSQYTQRYIHKAYGIQPKLCPLGVDTERFSPQSDIKRKGILFVGNKTLIDGYDLLEEALKHIPQKQRPKLNIIAFDKLRTFSKTTSEIIRAYRKAEITVCLAVLEPFGLVALESMACNTPVIAVKEGGYRETVIGGKTGYLIERNPKELAEKIMLLLKDKELRKKLGENARKHVIKNFTWENNVKKLEEIFKEIVS